MRAFGFHPDDVITRLPGGATDSPRTPTLASSIAFGGASLAVISVIAFSPWAFGLIRGEPALYSVVALIFIALTGVTFQRLIIGPGATHRFALLFGCAFAAYAIVWCAFWFGLRGKHHADLWGNITGALLFGFLVARAFGGGRVVLPLLVLLVLYLAGYYAGGAIYAHWRRPYGALGWGAAYGLGLGTGLGYLLYAAQLPLKNRLGGATSPSTARLSATPSE